MRPVPPAWAWLSQWAAWSLTHGTATSALRPFIGTNSPGCFFVFVVFLKKDSVFVVESRHFKNTSKGYNQVMKMLKIIKDNTKIFTKIFTKAILKIIDLHTEHHTF